MRRLATRLIGQERALENARSACLELSRLRAERDEIESFLARHVGQRRRTAV